MFPVTITLTSAAQLNAVMAALALAPAAGAEPTTAQLVEIAEKRGETVRAAKEISEAGKPAKDAAAPGKTTAKVDAAPEKTADASGQSAGGAAAESQASTAATEPIPYEQVGKAITEKAKTDRAHVLATLDKFGVKKGPELKREQYADFLKALG